MHIEKLSRFGPKSSEYSIFHAKGVSQGHMTQKRSHDEQKMSRHISFDLLPRAKLVINDK